MPAESGCATGYASDENNGSKRMGHAGPVADQRAWKSITSILRSNLHQYLPSGRELPTSAMQSWRSAKCFVGPVTGRKPLRTISRATARAIGATTVMDVSASPAWQLMRPPDVESGRRGVR